MKARDLMTSNVAVCHPGDTLEQAARAMWERDVGVVPVVDDRQQLLGVITDRDACMAAYTRGQPLSAIPVEEIMARDLITVRPEDSVAEAEARMRVYQIRRIPVVDGTNTLKGIVSLNDLALAATSGRRKDGVSIEEVAQTLAAACRHRFTEVAAE